jgi:iron complex outermembrane recepter protein
MKTLLLCLALYTMMLSAQAQTADAAKNSAGSIGGKISDYSGNPVAYATLILLDKDSALVKADYSREDGSFLFANIVAGEYRVGLRSIQYEPYCSNFFRLHEAQQLTLETIMVQEAVRQLKEVKVTATRQLIEVHPDKIVFNVSESPNAAGTDAIEMLRQVPGVIIDKDNNIILLGKSGVKVYIDGKPTYLSGENLANMLQGMQSDGVESVEVITNPSARYEAEGNAGIIDIKLKRDKNLGFKGRINGTYRLGRFSTYRSRFDFDFRNKRLNFFGNCYSNDVSTYFFMGYMKTIGNNFQDMNTTNIWNGINKGARIGSDYMINKKHLLGFVVNGYRYHGQSDRNTYTPFGNVHTGIVEQILYSTIVNHYETTNVNSNLNYVYNGLKGAKLNVDADYGYLYKDFIADISNIFRDKQSGMNIREKHNADNRITGIDIYSLKADYKNALGLGEIEFGGKISDVRTDNSFEYFNLVNESRIKDINLSSEFFYQEKIGAAYAIYNGKFNSKLSYNTGLRMEHTSSKGVLESVQKNDEDLVERSYTDVFPSGGIAYQPNKMNKFVLNYSRRIDRPVYERLNPFLYHFEEFTFHKGNPFLNPSYTNNFQLIHTFNSKLVTQISYSKTTDYIGVLVDTLDSKHHFSTYLNMESHKNLGMNISYSFDISKKWNCYANGNFFKSNYSFDLRRKGIDLNVATFYLYAKSTFLLPHDFNLEISGWYNSPSIIEGYFKAEKMWSLDTGVRKAIWEKRLDMRASLSDIFKTSNARGMVEYDHIKIKGAGRGDSRRFTLNLSYQIGNQQVKNSRTRKTGLDEEQKRLGGDGQ